MTVQSIKSVHSFHLPIIPFEDSDPLLHRIQIASRKALKSFEKTWSYAGKALSLSRHLMNTAIKSCSTWIKRLGGTDQRLTDAIRRLKLFTIISVPFGLMQIPGAIAGLKQNIRWKDGKESLLSGASITLLAVDTLDTLATFGSAALQTFSHAVPAIFASVGLPFAMIMNGTGSFHRSVRIWDMTKFIKETENKTLTQIKSGNLSPIEVKSLLSQYVEKHLPKTYDPASDPAAIASERKHREALVERKSNGTALKALIQLEALAAKEGELTQDDIKEAIALLSEIGRLIRRERKINAAYMGANFFGLGAIALGLLAIGTYAPYLFLSGMVAVRLATQTYQDKTR